MATSLAKQLSKLQAPQTSLLLKNKHHPSLLFDPKEAATLDRETVFEIGELNIFFSIKHHSIFHNHHYQYKKKNFTQIILILRSKRIRRIDKAKRIIRSIQTEFVFAKLRRT